MKLRTLLALTAAFSPVLAFSQEISPAIKAGNEVLIKIQKLNVIKFVTPLLLKKDQIYSILTTLAKCRSKELEIRELDAQELKKLDAKVTKALNDSLEGGSYPKKELQSEIIKVQDALVIRRRIATNEMVDMVLETCKKTLNEGQMTAMKNLIDPSYMVGNTKADKLPDEEKVKLYIREILLDGMTYDILKTLGKNAKE